MSGYFNAPWFAQLKQAVSESNIAAVAARMGYSRTAISLVMNGKYLGKTDKIAARVAAAMNRWPCPYLGCDISADDCAAVHACPTPSHDPARLAHRRMCRTCIHKGAQP